MTHSLFKRLFGILFVAGDTGVRLDDLSETLEESSEAILACLDTMNDQLRGSLDLPIELVNYNQHYRFITCSELAEDVKKFAQIPLNHQLSKAAIETLAIIAYRQPITRLEIDHIRGVSSSAMIQKLILRDLVRDMGRLEAPGRPVLYGVTPYFLEYFGLTCLEDLPPIEPIELHGETIHQSLFSNKEWEVRTDELEGDI